SASAVTAQTVGVRFATASITVNATIGLVTVHVQRSGNLAVQVSVSYATSNGSAIAGQDYTATAGAINFPPNATDATFSISILASPSTTPSSSSVNLPLSHPIGGPTLDAPGSAILTIINNPAPVSQFIVTNTNDSGPGSLRAAILAADAEISQTTVDIQFE